MTAVRLMRLETFEEVATLTNPDAPLVNRMAFSRDSGLLAAASGKAIHLWDLRAVRRELRRLDLDWDEPEYPATAVQVPCQVEVGPNRAGP